MNVAKIRPLSIWLLCVPCTSRSFLHTFMKLVANIHLIFQQYLDHIKFYSFIRKMDRIVWMVCVPVPGTTTNTNIRKTSGCCTNHEQCALAASHFPENADNSSPQRICNSHAIAHLDFEIIWKWTNISFWTVILYLNFWIFWFGLGYLSKSNTM